MAQVGRSLSTLLDNDQMEVEQLLERCRDAPAAELEAGVIKTQLLLRHKYLDPVPVEVTLSLAGAVGARGAGRMELVDARMAVRRRVICRAVCVVFGGGTAG